MRRITTLVTQTRAYLLMTTADTPFEKLGKYMAIDTADVTEGRTNRKLTGLDVLTSRTLESLIDDCHRHARGTDFLKAHPMPEFNAENPSPDFVEWSKQYLNATEAKH